MQSDKTFEESLKIGTAAEDIVYEYLIRTNSFVMDMRKQKHDEKGGPRLKGTEGSLVLPDFVVYNKDPRKGNFAIDVKFKNSIYTVNDKKCFTVDNKFEEYKRVVQIQRLDFLKMAFVHDDKIYMYRDIESHGTTTFGNQYGSGLVYLFEFNSAKQVY